MKKIRNLTQRSPIIFCLLFMLTVDGIFLGLSNLTQRFPSTSLFSAITELIHIAWPIMLAVLLGFGFVFKTKGFIRTFKVGWIYLALFSAALLLAIFTKAVATGAQWESWDKILVGLLSVIGIGIREEVLYRGVLVNALGLKYAKDAKGLWLTTLIASILFGFTHITNVFFGVPLVNVLIQSLGAVGIGIGFVAIYLRGGNIWFLAIVHTVIDLSSLFESTFLVNNLSDQTAISNLSIGSQIVQLLIGLAVALILLRKSKRKEIFDNFESLRAELEF